MKTPKQDQDPSFQEPTTGESLGEALAAQPMPTAQPVQPSQLPPEVMELIRRQQESNDQLRQMLLDMAQQQQLQLQQAQGSSGRRVLPLRGGGFDDADYYWIRVKPYNKDLGHVRMAQFCDELGFKARGGTGKPGDIPQWYQVTPEQAQQLARHHQRFDNPNSPLVFDIVTDEERYEIDQYEEMHRTAQLGIGALPSYMNQKAARRLKDASQQLPTRRPAPSLVSGAQAAQQAAQREAEALTQIQVLRPQGQLGAPQDQPQVAPGRAAAMQGLGQPQGRQQVQQVQQVQQAQPADSEGHLDFAAMAVESAEAGQMVAVGQRVAAQAAAELGRDPMRPMGPRQG